MRALVAIALAIAVARCGGVASPETTVAPATATATPAPSPVPTRTARVTATPSPRPKPSPTPRTGVDVPLVIEGRGNKIARYDIPQDEFYVVNILYTGPEDYLGIWTIDERGEEIDLLVNTVGRRYVGNHALGLHDDVGVAFKIEAAGRWRIAIKSILLARDWDGVSRLAGNGDDVVLMSPSSGLRVYEVRYPGESNVSVWAWGVDSDGNDQVELMINDIGPYRGEVLMPDGTFILEIETEGPWAMTFVE